MLSIIITSKNEEKTISNTILSAKKSFPKMKKEVLLVDNSSDRTAEIAKKEGVDKILVQQDTGKGNAMRLGFENSSGDIISFTDADISNINEKWIECVVEPILKNEADATIGCYTSPFFMTATETVYRPLIKLLFSEVEKCIISQPLSGQRAFRRKVLEQLELFPSMGVEAAMNIDLVMKKINITEVPLPEKIDRYKGNLQMVPDIIEAIIDMAKKYERYDKLKNSNFKNVIELFHDSLD